MLKNFSLLWKVHSQSISFWDNCTPGFLSAELRSLRTHKFHLLAGGEHSQSVCDFFRFAVIEYVCCNTLSDGRVSFCPVAFLQTLKLCSVSQFVPAQWLMLLLCHFVPSCNSWWSLLDGPGPGFFFIGISTKACTARTQSTTEASHHVKK